MDLSFEPFFLFPNSHQQTIIGSFFSFPFGPKSETKYVLLPDGDILALEITTPRKWTKENMTVAMIHGLGGSHRSPYLIRMVKKLKKRNVRSVRINLRGCGSGKGKARKLYHAGQSADIVEVLKVLKQDAPESPLVLIGFSLGGNLVLKMAGELKESASVFVQKIISVNPPIDLLETVKKLSDPDNWIYEKYFILLLRNDVKRRERIFPDLQKTKFPLKMSFLDFDEMVIAPNFGYSSAQEYYSDCSSKKFIPDICVPCKILLAKDDPIIASHSIDEIKIPSHVEVYTSSGGGHMGYLGSFKKGGFYWLDNLLLNWIFTA